MLKFTTNPDSPYHWLKVNHLDRAADLDMTVFHFTLDDNPTLDPEYVANLKAEYVGLWYKRYILGLWVLAEGAVYDMWDEAKHVVDKLPFTPIYYDVAVDYGTGNPTAFGLFGSTRDRAGLEREYYYDSSKSGRQKSDAEYSAALKEWLGPIRPRSIIVDPSAASFKVQLRKDGFNQVRDADNSVIDGIRTQATMLASGLYVVCSSCKQTISDYSGYVWDAKAQVRGEDKPLPQGSHTKDMERYYLFTTFGRGPVRAVKSLY